MYGSDAPGSAATNYQEQEILNESPLALIARVYDMAVVQIARARAGLAAGDASKKGQAVWRASRCISLLQVSLEREKGGEVAGNLDRLYGYLLSRISQAHIHNDDGIFAEVAQHLTELGSAWREVADRDVKAPAVPRPRAAAVAAAP